MTIAVVLSDFPIPTDSGDPLRALQFCQAVRASGVPVAFYVVERSTTTDDDRAAFAAAVPGAQIFRYESRWTAREGRIWAAARWVRATAIGRPAWIEQRYSPSLAAQLRRTATQYSRLYAVNEASGPYVLRAKGNWHWDKSNVLIASRRLAVRTADRPAQRIKALVDLFASWRFERAVGRKVCSVSVTSADEAVRWTDAVASPASSVLPSTVPVQSRVRVAARPRTVVWLGTFRYKPNWDGLVRFLDSARARFDATGARLVLVGSGGSAETRQQLKAFDFVDYVGYVEDLQEVLDGSSLGVVPVWDGAGIKMKTLTLMSYGVPVVSTTVGAEGVPREAFLAISDDATSLAEHATAPYSEAELVAAGAQAHEVVENQFSSLVFDRSVIELVSGAAQ